MSLSAAKQLVENVAEAAKLDKEAKRLLGGLTRVMTYVLIGFRDISEPKLERERENLMQQWRLIKQILRGTVEAPTEQLLDEVNKLIRDLGNAQRMAASIEQERAVWDQHNERRR